MIRAILDGDYQFDAESRRMQELGAERDFFDRLRRVSSDYGEAMAAWGQEVHDAVASEDGNAAPASLLRATDAAVDRLITNLITLGERHDDPHTPQGGAAVLDALDRLLGASAELLREARAGLEQHGLAALATLSPRITELRGLEAEVERSTDQVRARLQSTFGNPGTP